MKLVEEVDGGEDEEARDADPQDASDGATASSGQRRGRGFGSHDPVVATPVGTSGEPLPTVATPWGTAAGVVVVVVLVVVVVEGAVDVEGDGVTAVETGCRGRVGLAAVRPDAVVVDVAVGALVDVTGTVVAGNEGRSVVDGTVVEGAGALTWTVVVVVASAVEVPV